MSVTVRPTDEKSLGLRRTRTDAQDSAQLSDLLTSSATSRPDPTRPDPTRPDPRVGSSTVRLWLDV